MGQEDLTRQFADEIGPFQRVHDRTLYLGEVQLDVAVDKAVMNGLKTFERRCVDGVDRGTHQYEVTHLGLLRHLLKHEFLEPPRVEIGQAFIDPDGENARIGKHLVPLDIPEMFCFGHPADNRRMWPGRPPEVERKAERNAGDHARLDAGKQGDENGRHHRGKIGL